MSFFHFLYHTLKSYKRLQLKFLYPGPLLFSYAIKEGPMKEWLESNPYDISEHLTLSTIANETRENPDGR